MTKPSMFLVLWDAPNTDCEMLPHALHHELDEALRGLAPQVREGLRSACRFLPPTTLQAFEQALAREEYETAVAIHNHWRSTRRACVVEMRWSPSEGRYVRGQFFPCQKVLETVAAQESARALQYDLDRFADVDTPRSSAMLQVAAELGMPLVTLVCDDGDASAIPTEHFAPPLREYRVYADAEGTYVTTVHAKSADEAYAMVGDRREDEWEAESGPSIGHAFKVIDAATGEEEDY